MSRSDTFFESQGSRVQSAIGRDQAFAPTGDRRGRLVTRTGNLGVGRALRDLGGWSKDTRRAIRGIRTLRRDAWVQVDPSISALTMEWLRAASPPLVAAIERHMVPLAEHAYSQWPVDTGASKSGIALAVVRLSADKVTARFMGLADYTFFVKYGKSDAQRLSDFDRRVADAMREWTGRGTSLPEAYERAAVAFSLASNAANAQRRAASIWRRATGAGERRHVYRLPSGADAAGEPAWQRQAVDPFWPATRAMAVTAESELVRLVTNAKGGA